MSWYTGSAFDIELAEGLPILAVSGCVGMIALAELAVLFGTIEYGLWIYVFALIVYLLAPFQYPNGTPLFVAFAVLPVFRLTTAAMPVFTESTLLWLVIVYTPFIPAVLYIVQLEQFPVVALRTRIALLNLPLLAGIGWLIAEFQHGLFETTRLIPFLTSTELLLLVFVMAVYVAFTEELIYRGLLQSTITAYVGPLGGIFFASVVFGLMHAVIAEPSLLLLGFCVGLVLGVTYEVTRSLATVTAIRAVTNVALFGIFPFLGTALGL